MTRGKIVLMGSGELTATMVEVHKDLLRGLGDNPGAIFLDTPAGFQLNVDQISEKAVDYFRSRIGRPLTVASFKSAHAATEYETERFYHTLREADFILIGPGSPTYAVRQWHGSAVPEILTRRITDGACLVAASAAALTVGRFTVPVYEIYKVGETLHWIEGMDILAKFGFNMVVVPHWNNAEGGTHDTRCCFMGESRFREMESLLPDDIAILGLDEHTALIMDLATGEAYIRGIGTVTFRGIQGDIIFEKGDRFSLDILRGLKSDEKAERRSPKPSPAAGDATIPESSFWDRIHHIRTAFQEGLDAHDPAKSTNALLELDQMVWKAQLDLESEEFIAQSREVMRDLIVLLGNQLSNAQPDLQTGIIQLVDDLLTLRNQFRKARKWNEADAIRDCLHRADIAIEDTAEGSRWRLIGDHEK